MAEISRISTLAIHTTAISNFSKVQADLSQLQDQISSGLKKPLKKMTPVSPTP